MTAWSLPETTTQQYSTYCTK